MPRLKERVKQTIDTSGRKVIYPKVITEVMQGETAITLEDAKELLGWEEVEGTEYNKEIYAATKQKVAFCNNVTNRPIYANVAYTLRQDILRGRWQLNGEPIIVGRTGLVLNGQHTLLALILANIAWEKDKEEWREHWPTPPTIDKVITSGVAEDDSVVNTMDTCKPRSLADVIYRSPFFTKLTGGERRIVSRLTEYAIRFLWLRTGAKSDAFAPLLTHAEALACLAAHPKLLEAVSHVHEENGKEGKLKAYTSPGYLAGMLYLMGSASSDPQAYRSAAKPDEANLDWSQWNKACDYVVLLASGGKETSGIRKAMAAAMEQGGLSGTERWAILAKGWLAYQSDKPITPTTLGLEYLDDGEGHRKLMEIPSVGGIDLGDPSTVDEEQVAAVDPEPEKIKAKAKAIKEKNLKRLERGQEPVKEKKLVRLGPPKKVGANWSKDDVAWVHDEDEDYLAQLLEDPWNCNDGECRVNVITTKGEEWEVKLSSLSLKKYSPEQEAKVKLASKTKPRRQVEYRIGDHWWVFDSKGNHWRGYLTEESKNAVKLTVDTGFQGAGNNCMVWKKDLRQTQPNGD
jgi:hypothetical protein